MATHAYNVAQGIWTRANGVVVTGCYSGGGTDATVSARWRNNPAMEGLVQLGPLPSGIYTVGPLLAVGPGHTGTNVFKLTPNAATLAKIVSLGRDPDSFYGHGDNSAMNFTASKGCIIIPHTPRLAIAADVVLAAPETEYEGWDQVVVA